MICIAQIGKYTLQKSRKSMTIKSSIGTYFILVRSSQATIYL